MASERRKGLPEFTVTTIAKVLAGDQACALSPWLSGHFDLDKRVRDDQGSLATWRANHSAALDALYVELKGLDWKVTKEAWLRVNGQTASIKGKADAVTQADGRRPTIWDVKTGKPRDSDITQVLMEMVLLPMSWKAPMMQFAGVVVYADHRVTLKPSEAEALKPRLFAKLRELAKSERPAANPGRDACRWCEVSETDCAERFREGPDAETEEF